MKLAGEDHTQPQDNSGQTDSAPIPQKKAAEKEPVKLPSSSSDPYKKDPSQQTDMEAKYQELLRKYNIIE